MPLTQRSTEPVPDPEDTLEGVCSTCQTRVREVRWKAKPPDTGRWRPSGAMGHWSELPSAECPKCGARVYLLHRAVRHLPPVEGTNE